LPSVPPRPYTTLCRSVGVPQRNGREVLQQDLLCFLVLCSRFLDGGCAGALRENLLELGAGVAFLVRAGALNVERAEEVVQRRVRSEEHTSELQSRENR